MLVDPHQTFDGLLVHEANRVVLRSVKRAVSHGSCRPGPLLVVGPASSGKTHLMHAAANHVLARDRARRLLLVTAESFMNELADDVRAGCGTRFAHVSRRT
jgi:chromosomal replication initiator protein